MMIGVTLAIVSRFARSGLVHTNSILQSCCDIVKGRVCFGLGFARGDAGAGLRLAQTAKKY